MKPRRSKIGLLMIAAGGLGAVSVIVAACGGGRRRRRTEDRAAAAGVRDQPLRIARPTGIREKVEELCEDCEIIYGNANQSTSAQQGQAEAALAQGAEVLVLDAVDATAVGAVVKKANEEEAP